MWAITILMASLWLVMPAAAPAEVVGHLTAVEGRVELLRGGKLPAVAAKARDGVEPGDVLRTKTLSRAQITFLDNTHLTLSPESRIAIEEYAFDPARGKRRAVLQLFQGLAHFVVTQVFKVQEPDFLIKTHTATLGVRGTDFGIRLSPNDSAFLNFHGLVRVGNLFPEVGGAFKKAEKIALAFGSATVDLKDMQGTVVARGLPPTLPFTITDEDRQLFMRQLSAGLKAGAQADRLPGGLAGPAANLPREVSPAVANVLATWLGDIVIPPRAALNNSFTRGSTSSELQTFTFSQTFSGGYLGFSAPLLNQPVFSGSISVSRTVAYPGTNFIAIFSGISGVTSPGAFVWPNSGGGPFTVTSNSVTVSGQPGGTFSGTMQLAGSMAGFPSTTFTLSGPVTIDPSGTLTFTTSGTLTATMGGSVPLTVSGTVTGGTMIQGNSSFMAANQTAGPVGPAVNSTGPNLKGIRPVPQTKL